MADHTTPFIPPLSTPSPDTGIHPPVIPSTSTSRSSQSRSGSNSSTPAMPPPGWGTPYATSGGLPFFGAGTPYTQAPFIPFSPYSNPSLSAGPPGFAPLPPVGPGGVSLDYRGYPDFLPPPTPIMTSSSHLGAAPVNPPVIPPVVPSQGTPWHSGPGAVPLHHTPSGGGGPPPGTPWQGGGHAATFRGGGGWPSGGGAQYPPGAYIGGAWGFTSPDGAWNNVPLAGGAWGSIGGSWNGAGVQPSIQPSQTEPPRRYEKEMGDRMPKWTVGSHYGPVLTPFQMQIAKAKLELNPLLTPVPESGPAVDKVHLRWNMLFESSLVHRSCDALQVSWSIGRKEPATFPRITYLKIVSEHFPWLIEVKARDAKTGVTCGEVIEAIASNMDKLTSKSDYEALSNNLKRAVLEAYRYNRSRSPDVPGGKMGEGLKRVDFLGQLTAFGGLEVDTEAITRVCTVVVPGYVVLKCNKREFLTHEEVRAQQARERAASRAPSRAVSSRSSRKGIGGVAGSSHSGAVVDGDSLSDSEDESDND